MSPLYLYQGKLLVDNNKLAVNEACCCGGCGTDCSLNIGVLIDYESFSLLYFSTEPAFVFDESQGSETIAGDFIIYCDLVDGVPTWTLLVSFVWTDPSTERGEQWIGIIDADSNGCPQDGAVAMNVASGLGIANIEASIF